MRWSERQLAMLREMGIRVWARDPSGAEDRATIGADVLVAEEAGPVVTAPVQRVEARAPAPAAVAPPRESTLDGAEWLVVGEAFDAAGGADDGSAGVDQERLLDNMLRAIRVARSAPGREGRACHLAIAEQSRVDIDAAIDRVRPRCILALGRAAANALLGLDEPPGRLRERVHLRNGIPVVVTFGLPYLLRHAEDKAKAWADLCRAVAAADSLAPA